MDLVLAVLVGFVSALVPVVNAEAYLVARIGLGAAAPTSAVGQAAGRALLVEATRRGSRSRVVRRVRARGRGADPPGVVE